MMCGNPVFVIGKLRHRLEKSFLEGIFMKKSILFKKLEINLR